MQSSIWSCYINHVRKQTSQSDIKAASVLGACESLCKKIRNHATHAHGQVSTRKLNTTKKQISDTPDPLSSRLHGRVYVWVRPGLTSTGVSLERGGVSRRCRARVLYISPRSHMRLDQNSGSTLSCLSSYEHVHTYTTTIHYVIACGKQCSYICTSSQWGVLHTYVCMLSH